MPETFEQTYERTICSKCTAREECRAKLGANNVEQMLETKVENGCTSRHCMLYKGGHTRPEDWKEKTKQQFGTHAS